MLCSNGINHLILFCLESFATLTVLQSKSTGNDCNLFCAWFWMSHLLLPHNTVAEILLQHNTPSITHKFQNAGSNQKTWLFFPIHLTAQILLPQIATSLELSKMASTWKGFGNVDEVIEAVAASTGFKMIQKGERCSFFLTGARLLEVNGHYAKKKMVCVVAFRICSL